MLSATRLAAGSSRCVRSSSRSSSNVTPAPLSRRLAVRAAAAEEDEIAAEEPEAVEEAPIAEEFDFNFSDAKKGNRWEPSDVDAALQYFESQGFITGSSELPYESEFVTNPLSAFPGGPEDSSWLADVDNSEAYERDEYALAGISEAAPKVKRRQDEEEEASDEALRAAEEEKLSASAFDDIEGLGGDDLGDDAAHAAVWNWRFDGEPAADEPADDVTTARLSEDAAFLAGVSEAELAAHPELSPEQKELMATLLEPLAADDAALDLIGQELPEPDEATEQGAALTADEEAAISSLLSEQPDISSVLAEAAALTDTLGPVLAEALAEAEAEAAAGGPPLEQAAVDGYIATLRSLGQQQPGGLSDATLAQVLGEEAGEELGDVGAGLEAETARLPAGLEQLLAEQTSGLEAFAAAAAGPEEAEASQALALLADIEALGAEVDTFNEAVLPAAEDLQEYEAYIDTALDYYASVGDEPLGPEPEGQAPINPYDELDTALLGASDAFGDDDDATDRYGPQLAERILELGRVTKVVKGGKLQGFRCVAVVGDGKGRVGVGCQAGREVATAVKRALVDAKKSIIEVPLVGSGTIPHRAESWFKAAGVVLQPAADGTGVIAGGAVRSVLELAGVQNVLAKRLGSRSTLNNARVTLKALASLRTMDDYADARGLPLDYMLS